MSQLTHRQKQIVDATLDIISTIGIQNLTIRKLAEKVGITEGAIYRHYVSKDEILVSVAEYFKTESTGILQQIVETDGDSVQKIKTFFLGRCRQFKDNPALAMVLFSDDIFKGSGRVQAEISATIHSHGQLLVKTIVEGQQAGLIRGNVVPEHMFMMIMGALRLLVTRWRASDFRFDLLAEGEKLWNSIEALVAVA